MDTGPAKVRQRVSDNVRPFSVGLWMTHPQLVIFDEFFTSTLKGGALTFEWQNPRTGNTADFRIVGQPTYSKFVPRESGLRSLVSFDIELMPGTEVVDDFEPPVAAVPWGGGRGHYGADGGEPAGGSGVGGEDVDVEWFVPRVPAAAAPAAVALLLYPHYGSGFEDGAGAGDNADESLVVLGETGGGGGPTIEKHPTGGAGDAGGGAIGSP